MEKSNDQTVGTSLVVILPTNHDSVLAIMHPHAAQLMRAKYNGTKVSALVGEDMVPAIRVAIQDCWKSLGHWNNLKDDGMLEHQTIEMARFFTTVYKNVTIQEFRIILMNMVNGDYKTKPEDIITCTVQSMCHAIKSYLASTLFKMAFTDYHAKLKLDASPVKKTLTPEEETEVVRTGCINVYGQFLTDGTMPVYGAPYYKYLKPLLKIEWTPKQSEEIKMIAKQRSIGNETNYSTECKNVALKMWFVKMKETGHNYEKFKSIIDSLKK